MSDATAPDLSEATSLPALFDALRPITPPPEISMMPQTAAWLWLLLTVLALFAAALFALIRRYKANAYRRAALSQLDQMAGDPAAVGTLLRRTALAAFPRVEVAALHGSDWLDFLDRTAPSAAFTGSPEAKVLTHGPYQRESVPSPELTAKARIWIKTHRGPTP